MTRTQLGTLAVIAIVATRLVIGWHFYSEGFKKKEQGDWSAAGFLGQAKGPFAEVFTSVTPQKFALLDLLLSDPAEEESLDDEQIAELAAWRGEMQEIYGRDFSDFTIEPTVAAWWHHREMLGDHYDFQQPELDTALKDERETTRKVVIQLRDKRRDVFKQLEEYRASLSDNAKLSGKADEQGRDVPADEAPAGEAPAAEVADSEAPAGEITTSEVTAANREALESRKKELLRLTEQFNELDAKYRAAEKRYKEQEGEILTVRNQHDRSIAVIERWTEQLEGWIAANYEDLREYIGYCNRVKANSEDLREYIGYRNKTNSGDPMREGVSTLQGQAADIEVDMKKKAAPLAAGLGNLWDGFNSQLNRVAVATQADRDKFEIERPDGMSDRLELINKVTPWFDMIVGGLLILGLFTRLAALAAAGFLATIVISQAAWLGDAPSEVFAYAAEMCALLVLAAVGAGRYAGLDFFLRCIYYSVFPPKPAARGRRSQRPATTERTDQQAEPIRI